MASDIREHTTDRLSVLSRVEYGSKIIPEEPRKRINDGEDLDFFLTSRAYVDISTFLRQLDYAMFPAVTQGEIPRPWPTQSVHVIQSPQVIRIKVLIQTLSSILKDTPPQTGPRRFGNAAFREWYQKVEARTPALMQQAMPENVFHHVSAEHQDLLKKELGSYFLGSFGSSERLDYGTGHELSFLAFLACVWRLNGFAPSEKGSEERGIVIGIIDPYLELTRNLIRIYSLEPAGSHGVWGLDDHSFIPYILGAAQLSPPVSYGHTAPTEGSLREAHRPGIVIQEQTVRFLSNQNLFFAAIAFIYDVKKGPFWEHSPLLYDISGIDKGWAKINQGLIKMYTAEVLHKFPVVQHLKFGSLLKWERHPAAARPPTSMHRDSQPRQTTNASAPWAGMQAPVGAVAGTAAPWARKSAMSAPGAGYSGNGSGRFPVRPASASVYTGFSTPRPHLPSQHNPNNS